MYVHAILFRMMLGVIPGKMSMHFGSMRRAMSTLFYNLTLGDSISGVWSDLWEAAYESEDGTVFYVFLIVFAIYVFLSMFTVLNMLIGVLCEVVSALSARSKEETLIDNVRETLLHLLMEFDTDGNQTIGKDEFQQFCDAPIAQKALTDLDVDILVERFDVEPYSDFSAKR